MFNRKIKVSLIIILSLSLVFCFGCTKSDDNTTNQDNSKVKQEVRLFEVTHSIFYAPQYVALELGFFEDEGLDVELSLANGGDKTMTALVSGSADIILVGAETTIYVNNQNPKDPVINFAQLTQTDGSFLVSRESIENFTWDMLKGKELLGQRKGGMPEMVSEYVQHVNGVEPKVDNEINQSVDYANISSAFVSGTGDFVQLFEPMASIIEIEERGYIVASFGSTGLKLPYTVYITKQSIIDSNPELVQSFTNAVYKAQQWVDTHSLVEIADVIAPQFPDINKEVLIQVLDRYRSQGSYATDPILDEEEYSNLENVMDYSGELTNKVPYKSIVNTEFAKKAINK